LTREDLFLVGSMILVVLALVEVLVTSTLAGQDRLPRARRFDRWSRVVFPVAFLVVLLVAFRLGRPGEL